MKNLMIKIYQNSGTELANGKLIGWFKGKWNSGIEH